ncbi:SDR family NAD(P)-dependent oxidoreductase [Steroidobacter flavus]|uniref:SDR family NAD(P)-dependent oxidoreductase n=1 Tax=Steroidobacter flavus TaxID=1842136 RepID=A0ABV8SYP1_9GAMM
MMSERAIIVTGASRGIGAAISEHLAQAGFIVGCLSRSGELPRREQASAIVRSRWIGLAADVTNPATVRNAIEHVAARGTIVGLVNNAGLHTEARSEELAISDWNALLAVNATSVLACSQSVYPHLVRHRSGLIVNIGSFFDKLGVKRNLAYCASKAAVAAMTRVLAVEWAAAGIRVLNVAPGYIVTDLNRAQMMEGPLKAYLSKRIPAGEPGSADDVAHLVASFFDIEVPFLTGETIYIDGAQGVAH